MTAPRTKGFDHLDTNLDASLARLSGLLRIKSI